MRLTRLLRSSSFRYAILYMLLFGVSVAGVLGFVYWRTVDVIAAQTEDTIDAEITGLAEQYNRRGLLGLIDIIQERSVGASGRRGLYLLVDSDYAPLAGNLSRWPEIARGPPGLVKFLVDTQQAPGAPPQVALARTIQLPQGFHLLVGRDTTERDEFNQLIVDAMIGGLGLTLVLGLFGGLVMSRGLLGRIDAIGRGVDAILSGDLKQRMPLRGNDDEFDRLAASLNTMLDQIDHLMTGMRGVGDSIAHDLRSPISRLRSRLEITLLGPSDTEGYRQAIQDTIREADAILATFNALLDIALAEAGAVRDRFQPVDLGQLAADAGELYAPVAEEKAVTLEVEAAPGTVVAGNHHLLSQAVANLLDNAIKYTPAGGHVRLAVTRDARGPCLTVADDGPGIPPAARDRVIERFVRLDASRSAPGSGLGLSLAAAVARLHKAQIELEDNAPGLRVTLRFPPAPPPSPA